MMDSRPLGVFLAVVVANLSYDGLSFCHALDQELSCHGVHRFIQHIHMEHLALFPSFLHMVTSICLLVMDFGLIHLAKDV